MKEKLSQKQKIMDIILCGLICTCFVSTILNMLYLFELINKTIPFIGITFVWLTIIIQNITNLVFRNVRQQLIELGIKNKPYSKKKQKIIITITIIIFVSWLATYLMSMFKSN